MGPSESTPSSSKGPEPKVQRVGKKYGLEEEIELLGTRWRGDDGPRQSLRDLANDFNRELLGVAMREEGMRPLDGEVANLYRLLTDNEVSAAQRTEAEAELERSGLDPAELRADFVSHQAVHTYLRDHRGLVLPEPDKDERLARHAETIQRTKGRLQSVTETGLDRLAGDGITLNEFDIFVSVQVYCDDCGRQFEIMELLDRGGCDCES